MQHTHTALGTHWWFEIHDAPTDPLTIKQWLTNRLSSFEANYTRFSNDSFIGQLNQTGELTSPLAELMTLLTRGQHWYRASNGVFNILTANQQIQNGYGQKNTFGKHAELSADPGRDLVVSPEKILLTRGAIDLGGFAKGWLIDAIARDLSEQFNLQHYLINGGGDIYATTLPDGNPFLVTVEHPTQKNAFIAQVPLRNQAFAASSTYKRQWQQQAETKHHLLGSTSTPDVANHVVANTAEEADIYATLGCLDAAQLQSNSIEYCLIPENENARYTQAWRDWLHT